jgi:hypothetical protein
MEIGPRLAAADRAFNRPDLLLRHRHHRRDLRRNNLGHPTKADQHHNPGRKGTLAGAVRKDSPAKGEAVRTRARRASGLRYIEGYSTRTILHSTFLP